MTSDDAVSADEGPQDVAILFVDLVGSSEFASVLGLREYAQYVDSFEELCRQQCRFHFETFLQGKYLPGRDYEFRTLGDELVVYLHTGNLHNDVYQLICLAIMLKCGWLCSPINARRIARENSSAELAAGVHSGKVWATRTEHGFHRRGFSINVAKRTESASREGSRFRIFVSDPAFKQVSRRMRNLVFGPRQTAAMKGVVVPIGVFEVVESFVNPGPRLAPECSAEFAKVGRAALRANSLDLWVHSCLQLVENERDGRVTDERLELCHDTLRIDPKNAVALYYAAQAYRERDDLANARLYLEDLTAHWPGIADGWLEFGRLLKRLGDAAGGRMAILKARRYGVAANEETLE
jgi:class 3 adenylate cyclase